MGRPYWQHLTGMSVKSGVCGCVGVFSRVAPRVKTHKSPGILAGGLFRSRAPLVIKTRALLQQTEKDKFGARINEIRTFWQTYGMEPDSTQYAAFEMARGLQVRQRRGPLTMAWLRAAIESWPDGPCWVTCLADCGPELGWHRGGGLPLYPCLQLLLVGPRQVGGGRPRVGEQG